MAQIKKLQVQGIRSFGPGQEDRQNIEFYSPLTLILGQNGCGKTTIIECLKYVTTGDVPPGCGTGGPFVHDPKMAREASVKGQVKLLFNTQGGTVNIISRSMEASQKAKTISVKTLDSTMSRRKAGQAPNEAVSISSKCADINLDMLNSLGVSKPILNYVIFCHQEDSNWPLDVGSKVKERFDEIFNSVKYKNCLKMVKDVRKKELEEAKIEKNNALHYKSDKEYADKKRTDKRRKEAEAVRLEESSARVAAELAPLKAKLLQVQEEEKGFTENKQLLAAAETSLEHCRRERKALAKEVAELLPEETTDEELVAQREGVERETEAKERELEGLVQRKEDQEEDTKKVEMKIQKNAAVIGKAVQEQEINQKEMRERDELLARAGEELDLADSQGDTLAAIRKEDRRLKDHAKLLVAELKEKEGRLEQEIDELKTRKAGLEEKKKRDQTDMTEHKREIAKLKKQLSILAGAPEQLEAIREEWTKGEKRLEEEKDKFDLDDMELEISHEKDTVDRLDAKECQLREEANAMEKQASAMEKINHITEDVESKRQTMNKVLNKRRVKFTELFGQIPEPARLRAEFKIQQEEAVEKLKELEGRKKEKEIKINNKSSDKASVKRDLDRKKARCLQLKSKCSDVLDDSADIEEEIAKAKEALEAGRKELQVKEAGKFVYKEQLEMLRGKASPPCPTCNRELKKKAEVAEVVQELEERVAGIPGKVRSLEGRVARQAGRLEVLQNVRPDWSALQQLGEEVKEAEQQTDRLEGEVRRLRGQLEDEDAELMVTEVAVTEWREVAEDVQAVDGLRRELEQLAERLAEARREAGGSEELVGGGDRGLEAVRKEAGQVAAQLRTARSNMDSCQRTVTQQRTRINQLEAELNKLTNRKLEIEGEQQRRTVTEAKREELEARVVRCGEAVSQSEAELGPARAELEAAEDRRKTVRRDGDRAIDANREKERRLEGLRGDIERLEAAVRTYVQDGKDASLRTSKREKVELESKLGEMRAGRADLESRISDLRVRVSGQDGRRRIFDDNLKLREYKRQENRHAGEVAVQRAALEDRDWGRVERKKNELNRKYNELNAEMNAMGGQQAEVERTVREMEKELNQKKLKDAAKLFKEMTVSHNLRTKVASDLNKYYIALDFAIMKYHREKMKVVNKIIRELWLQVYRGNDIDYIEIKTDDADSVQSGADKKKTYSYRVVMVKNDTEMDMRARCSAGQKVLASLIIRLALAETFSTNCGIIALDEPTTNLDRENIESLASALADIANKRADQRNFQLVVITHDEDFIESLSRCDKLQYYQKVTRNARGLSEVRRMNINALEPAD